MDYNTYQQRVLARASHRWHNERVPLPAFLKIMTEFMYWGNQLDKVKKGLMYDRPCNDFLDEGNPTTVPMIPEKDQRIFHAMIGFATEGVEMMEAAYGYFFEDKDFDIVNLQEEFGDGEWYRAFGLSELGQTHEQNIQQNDAKLEARYGGVFSELHANNRDVEAERAILEGNRD